MELHTQRYNEKISGIPGFYDRIFIAGALPVFSNSGHLSACMFENNLRIFDYAKFAEPYRDRLRENAQSLAAVAGIEIEYIRSSGVRKESAIEKAIKKRGMHPGAGTHNIGN